MRKLLYCASLISILFCVGCGDMNYKQNESMNKSAMFDKMTVAAPVAKKVPQELIAHGDTRIDNYYWMNQREDPEVISHLEAENRYIMIGSFQTLATEFRTLDADNPTGEFKIFQPRDYEYWIH